MKLSGRNWRVLVGDVLDVLRTLPDESVQCVVTSPPYWNLRDYGVDGQIGLESSPDEFVARMVEVFAEVHRVLRDDGVLFVNLGDSYAAHDGQRKASDITNSPKQKSNPGSITCGSRSSAGLKPKDLCGIPWRVALALQAWGWYWRDCIVWHKRSPMPESVQDRCTKAWEPIFMFTKSARYFWDQEAVKEAAAYAHREHVPRGEFNGKHDQPGSATNGSFRAIVDARNLRNVWTLSNEPCSEGHYAVFPSEIPRRCIKAGSSEKGCCPKCGTPWLRVTKKTKRTRERPNALTKRNGASGTGNHCANTVAGVEVKTTGWEPSCECGIAETVPCRVLDPFSGSGTTGMVATELGREYIGIELNQDYAAMSAKRIESWKYRDVEKPLAPLPGQAELF